MKLKDGTEVMKPLNSPYDKNDESIDRGVTLLDYGIDRLGDMVWAFRRRSVNYGFYGDLHNHGHILIGYSHDPKGEYYKQV